jgi:HAD superfamily hydrolase (TIGR01509 family)
MTAAAGADPVVVFDCDGVLVDSEDLSWTVWTEVLARHGYAVTPEDEAASLGRRLSDLHAHFAARVDLPAVEPFADEITAATLRRFDEALQPFSDAVALLAALRDAGVRLAVASSSSRTRLAHALDVTGIGTDPFEAVVASDEVAHGKPAPDLYLRAAEQLGVPAASCWAIEDSPPGVASARAAGMRVIAVLRGHVAREDLVDADLLVDRLDVLEVRGALLG